MFQSAIHTIDIRALDEIEDMEFVTYVYALRKIVCSPRLA